jgi:hypothetical protein
MTTPFSEGDVLEVLGWAAGSRPGMSMPSLSG